MRRLLPLLLLPLLACSGADPLPADAAGVTVYPLVAGSGDSMKVVETGEKVCCLGDVLLDQERIASVNVIRGDVGVPEVRLVLDDRGARTLAEYAAANVGTRLAVEVGDEVRTAPLLLPEFETRWLTLAFRQPAGAVEAAEALAARIGPGIGKSAPAP